MEDVFIECLVKRKNSLKINALRFLVIFGAILLSFILFYCGLLLPGISFIFMLLVVGVIYGAWYLFGSFKVEYEYIVTNGEMDVDKIMAQRKRKRLVTINLRDIEIMAPMGGQHKREFENQSIKTTIDASISPDSQGAYFIVTNHPKNGMMRLVFNPDERIIKSAKTFSPRKVFTD